MERERGSCPACGSERVIHIRFGLPPPDASAASPEWVRYAGCVVEPGEQTRRCEACGHAWGHAGAELGPA